MVRKIILKSLLLFIIGGTMLYCDKDAKTTTNPIPSEQMHKINGISFTGPVNEIDISAFEPMVSVEANWVSLMPFAFGQLEQTILKYDLEWQWWGEKRDGIIKCTEYARQNNMKVFLKPQVWFSHGAYTGDFDLTDDEQWNEWEQNYLGYIIKYAKLADSLNIELYSIGVEFENFVDERPEFWQLLIDSVRSVYSGEIVYSGNWDNFINIPFWDQLDYIGISAYFPLSSEQTPEVKNLLENWNEHFNLIKSHSKQFGKTVLFTEYGYKSIDFTALTPWNPNNNGEINLLAQQNTYEALYQKFWDEPWFSGGFLWKWYDDHEQAGGNNDKDFTPQNKPVEITISYWYGK